MDTLNENEVDIGEVQVGLCDNMIGTTSAIWESYDSKDDTFTWEQAKSWVVGELIKSKFKRVSRLYKPCDIIEDMRQDYGINMSYEKAWRARENAYERVRGSPEESYNLLRRYGEALKLTNPGFLNCIRSIIVMDGTFLKNKYRGQLIVSVCLDSNNQIYPLAFGAVDRETDNSIQWFLEKLKGAIGEVPNLGFMTDRKTCFSKGISSVFSSAFHGLCVQHLIQNLHDKYKNDTVATLFYNASRTYRESTFLEAWTNLLAFPNGLGKYLNDIGIARWSRVQCPRKRYNMMTTNIAESMNSILKEPRDLPIASFLEHVQALLHRWFWERREEGIKVTSTLTKWAEMTVPSDKYFTVTVSCQLHKIGSVIKDKLTKEQLQIFDKTIFGPLLNVNMVFNENKKIITCLEIEEIFKNLEFTNDHDAVKVALAVFIETVMVGKDKKTQFDMDILERVDDEEVFKSFDWSTFFYTRLLNSLKTSLQRKKEAYELKKTKSSKAVVYYNIKDYVLMLFRCGIMKSSQLQLSTQEKAFMESRIQGDDNMQMEDDDSIPDINNSDTNTSDHAMNNKSLEQSDSSPQLSKKSNDKEQQSHSKSIKKLKNEIKEVRKDLSTLTSMVSRMDGTIRKQSLELSEMKQMLERLVQNQNQNQGNDQTHQNFNDDDQNREDMTTSDQPYVEEQHTEEQHTEPQEETQREHQEEAGSDISIDSRDANLLLTIRDISDNLNLQIDWRKCKIYVFDSMPNYVEKKLVDQVLEMPARCIASLAIAIGVNLHSK
ncbi:MuDRA-like transposase [Cucumis melo var. makuwa]|uniref:MuDRA-like transposase n=1 Tax=Cucumis melo var. makuwa TaxID=1194695 RepID=A0A5A7V2Q6_CUCMM|nr:MuDRA-like transposase [Cucumis melo var. makuwa]